MLINFTACIGSFGHNCSLTCKDGYFGHGCRSKCECNDSQTCEPQIGCTPRSNHYNGLKRHFCISNLFFKIMYKYLHTCKFENICLYQWKSCIRDAQPSIIILNRFYTEHQLHVYSSCHCGYPFRACYWNSFVFS